MLKEIFINRRGEVGSQVLFFEFLFLLIIVSIGIIAGITLFFGSEYEFRHVDAGILNLRIRECLRETEIDWSINGDLYVKCRLNREIVERDYTLEIENLDLKDIVIVNKAPENCKFEGGKSNDNFPKCVEKESKGINGEKYRVLTGSNQKIKKEIAKI